LADGTQFVGFITPEGGSGEVAESDLGTMDPCMFSSEGALLTFWGGLLGFTEDDKMATYNMLERSPENVFPIRFTAEPGLTSGRQSGTIHGFYKINNSEDDKIETTT
jgi:hypothetical protein